MSKHFFMSVDFFNDEGIKEILNSNEVDGLDVIAAGIACACAIFESDFDGIPMDELVEIASHSVEMSEKIVKTAIGIFVVQGIFLMQGERLLITPTGKLFRKCE